VDGLVSVPQSIGAEKLRATKINVRPPVYFEIQPPQTPPFFFLNRYFINNISGIYKNIQNNTLRFGSKVFPSSGETINPKT